MCSADDDERYEAAVASAAGRDVVVVGGDGSIHRLLQEVHDQGLFGQIGAVGVVPMGTGNDLARGAGLPLEPTEAAVAALTGAAAYRDLLVGDDGEVVINAVHAGVAAEATAEAGEVKGVLGKAAYSYGALRAGMTSTGWHLRVVVDGETVVDGSEKVLMVTLAVGPSVGGGTPDAPEAQPDDGRVEVVVARGVGPVERVAFARDLRKGTHVDRPDVTTVRGCETQVEAVGDEDAFRVNNDGDVNDEHVPARTWTVRSRAWQLRGATG